MKLVDIPTEKIDRLDHNVLSDSALRYIESRYNGDQLQHFHKERVKRRIRLSQSINKNKQYYFGTMLLLRWMEMTIDSCPVLYRVHDFYTKRELVVWQEDEARIKPDPNLHFSSMNSIVFAPSRELSQRDVEFKRYLGRHRVHMGVLTKFMYEYILECRDVYGRLIDPTSYGVPMSLHLSPYAHELLDVFRPWFVEYEQNTVDRDKKYLIFPAFTAEGTKVPIGSLLWTQELRDRKERLVGELVSHSFEEEEQREIEEIRKEKAHAEYIKFRIEKFNKNFFETRLLLRANDAGLHTYLHNSIEPIEVESPEEYERLRAEQDELFRKISPRVDEMAERIERLRLDRLHYMQQEFDRYARKVRDTADGTLSEAG